MLQLTDEKNGGGTINPTPLPQPKATLLDSAVNNGYENELSENNESNISDVPID